MVKFTEIFSAPKRYDPELGKVVEEFEIREVFLNPSYVITARENSSLYAKAQKQELIKGLKREMKFTQVFLNIPGSTAKKMDVVGDFEYFAERIGREV